MKKNVLFIRECTYMYRFRAWKCSQTQVQMCTNENVSLQARISVAIDEALESD